MKQESFSLNEIYRNIVLIMKDNGVETPAIDARFIIEERTSFDWSDIIVRPDVVVENDIYNVIMRDVSERISGKPLSRIYGKREFWGLSFILSPDTLDPRPDTELIIDLSLQHFLNNSRPKRILDLGTGSGCILISLLSEFPDSIGVGVDLSEGAAVTARYNAQQNACADRASFICGSWADAIYTQQAQQKFDLIVSNPPYISNQEIMNLSKEVKNHDPILSLDGGEDGLQAYKYIFSQIKNLLSEDGIAFFEIGYDQQNDITRLSKTAGLMQRGVHVDLAGNPRVVEISCGDK